MSPNQAATLAAKLANDECERLHKKRPFTPEQYAAVIEGDKHRWGRLDEAAKDGLGSNPKVEVYFSTDIIRSQASTEATEPMIGWPDLDPSPLKTGLLCAFSQTR